MLDNSDTETVRAWLKVALEEASGRGKSKADLARFCDVSDQAVNGWVKTGRITKKNLELAARFFGYGPRFTKPPLIAAEPVSEYSSWPFRTIEKSEILNLSILQLERLEKTMRSRLDEWSEDQGKQNPTTVRAA